MTFKYTLCINYMAYIFSRKNFTSYNEVETFERSFIMEITLNEIEGIRNMYRRDLATMDLDQEDIDYIDERLQYWNEFRKKLLEG